MGFFLYTVKCHVEANTYLTGSVASGKSPALSEPSRPQVWTRDGVKTCPAGLWRSAREGSERALAGIRRGPLSWAPLRL